MTARPVVSVDARLAEIEQDIARSERLDLRAAAWAARQRLLSATPWLASQLRDARAENERLAEFCRWLIAMDDPSDEQGRRDRQTVTLARIISRAHEALAAERVADNLRRQLLAETYRPEGGEIVMQELRSAKRERDDLRARLAAAERGLEMTDAELEGTRKRADHAEAALAAVLEPADALAEISRRVTASYPEGMDDELVMRRRVGKVGVEYGELLDAIEGWTGENPRKGVYASKADVIKELIDCASASLCAVEYMTGDEGRSIELLAEQVNGNKDRLDAALAAAEQNDWKHLRLLEPHLAVIRPGSEHVDRPSQRRAAVCVTCGEVVLAAEQDELAALPDDWFHRDGRYPSGETFTYCLAEGPERAHCCEPSGHGADHRWGWFTKEQRARAEQDELPRCVCDGASYYSDAENAARPPFIVSGNCPVHVSQPTEGSEQ